MGSVVEFTAINSKIKTLMGKMLKEKGYLELFQSKDLKTALSFLKYNTNYGEFLKDYDLDKIHRGELEIILNRGYVSIYKKFINYFHGEHRKLIKNLFLKWEIEDLKIIFRGKYIGRSKEEIKKNLIAMGSLNTIDYDYLLSAKNVQDLGERLKGTIYYNGVKNLVKDVSEKGLFRIETELDFVYFSTIRKELKQLNKENREVVKQILGVEGDMLNLGWIYRGKKFYNITPEELFNYTIYDGYKLSKEHIKRLCYANSIEDFNSIIGKTPYALIYNNEDSNVIEKREREFQKKFFGKYLRENKANFGVIMSYLIIYRIEIQDIISIIEQKRYAIDMSTGINYVSVTL